MAHGEDLLVVDHLVVRRRVRVRTITTGYAHYTETSSDESITFHVDNYLLNNKTKPRAAPTRRTDNRPFVSK